jgi:hypothetical protein
MKKIEDSSLKNQADGQSTYETSKQQQRKIEF